MKKIFIIIISIYQLISANDINWVKYNDFMLNNKNNKPAIYMLSASYCSYCKETIKLLNSNNNLNYYIKENFIPIYEEVDTEETPKYLYNNITPTIYILNNKGEIVGKPIIGIQTKEVLLKYLNQSLYKINNGVIE